MKRLASVFAVVALGIVLVAPGTALGDTTWSAPTLLNTNGTTDSGGDTWPQIIEDSSGTLHAVWFSDEDLGGTAGIDEDIFYATNTGSGWSAPTLLNTNGTTDSGNDREPQIIEDSFGTLHAVWHSAENLGGTAGTDYDIFYATNTGSGWSAPTLLNINGTTDSGYDQGPQIIEDSSGTLHAVWRSYENLGGTAGTDEDIFYATNSGSGWSVPVLLNTNGATDLGRDWAPQIIEDATGMLHAVWHSVEDLGGTGTDYDIFYATNSGSGWSAPMLLNINGTSDSGQDEFPQIIEDSSGTLHAVWNSGENLGGTAGTDWDIFYATNTGSGWSYPALLNTNGTTDSGSDAYPQIIEDGSGTLHAVWCSGENLGGTAGTDYDIFYATNTGSGWSYPALLNINGTSDSGYDAWPQIIEDSSGTLHAVWHSYENLGGTAGTDEDIFYATNSGSGWSYPVLLNIIDANDSGNDYYAQIIEDSSGTLHAVWESDDDLGGTAGTDWDIFYATNSGGGWSYPVLLNTNGTTDSETDYKAQIIEDSSGTLHAVWNSYEDLGGTAGTDIDIFYASNSGSGWSYPVLLNTNGTTDSVEDWYPQIIEDGSGTLHAVWGSSDDLGGTAGIDYDIFYATNSGGGWSYPVLLNANGTGNEGRDDAVPQIIEDSSGTLHAVWMSVDYAVYPDFPEYDIFYATNTGSGWSYPMLLNTNGTTDSGWDKWPQIIEDSSGTLHAVWGSDEDLGGTAGIDDDIFYATNTGSGWSAPTLLNTNGAGDSGRDAYPQIIEDGSGTLHAVWQSSGTAGTDLDIFYATNSGSGWSAPALLNTNGTTDSGNDYFPQIIEDGSGTIHVVWHSNENLNGTAGTDWDIFYATGTVSSSPQTIYVDDDSSCPGSGTIGDPYCEIQTAIDNSTGGDTIIVRDGTYTGTGNKNLDFHGKAVTLRSENGPVNCTIDCESNGRGFYFHNGETVDSVVDGFTVINGFADGSAADDKRGGGIHCQSSSSPTITNCIVSGNSASVSGGGISCDASSPAIINCTISGNSSGENSGGIYCRQGSSPSIIDCTISGNSTDFYGGGINCSYNCSPTIIGCTISDNTSGSYGSWGGGITCSNDSSPAITNCTITGNSSDYDGGAIYCSRTSSPAITNCTITGNSTRNGGAIHCSYDAWPVITNCILWGDSITGAGREIYLTESSSITVSYSDVEGGQIDAYAEPGCTLDWGTGNIDIDPLFVGGGDYHLSGASPCIDVATDAGVYTDIDGDARPSGTGYEMGSDEVTVFSVGSGPSDDFSTIQPALNAMAGAALIIVRDGTYGGNLDFGGNAIVLRSENGPANCIIDSGGVGRGFHFHSGETSSSVVDGFTIINGNTIYGGGIYCESSSPTITNCVISDNWADYGGGICCDFASPTITACTISGNAADFRGGGIDCYDNSSPSITNCIFNDNTAVYGGGICCYWYSSPSVTNCTTSANWANYGGGIACYYSSSPTITNCIMWGDGADNGDEIVVFNGSSPSVAYSDVEGGQAAAIVDFFTQASLNWLAGNIDPIGLDPEFVNPTVDDYHLQCGSPCIDAGDPGSDYSNEPEPNGGRINMGAYGNSSEAATSEICPAHGDWFVSVPNFGGGTADELAVLGVAKSTGAIMAQTKDATGGSSLADTDYLSAAWEPFGMAVVSDFAGGAADEIAALATDTSSGSVIVQVKDATGGAVLANTYYLSAGWNPEGLAVVSDFGGGVSDELAVLATADSSGAVIVQVKDATGGTVLASTYYLSSGWDPKGLAVVPDFGGGASDELAVLAVDKSSGAVIVQVKDATGGAALASTYYLSSAWKPVGLAIVPDFGGGASDELAVLAVDKSTGAVIVQVKDATGGAALASTYYLSSAWKPVGLAVVPDFGGGASDELALLAVNRSSGEVIVQVRDATGGAALASTYYLTGAWDARAIEVVADFSGGADELAVLAVGKSSGAITVEVRDATGGPALATTSYLNAGWNTQP